MGDDKQANQSCVTTSQSSPKLNPGDQAQPGTPGSGENVCPDCSGKGQVNNQPCQTCGGTGVVEEGIGGA
jgi:DnaJ-class molecular chaperone